MYRLAIISDVHADVHALTDALAAIDRRACDEVVCAGDVVDFGLFPDETIAMLAAQQIPAVRGNHERWALKGEHRSGWGADLSPASKRWLAGLPTSLRMVYEGVRVAVHHASPVADMAGVYPEQIKAHEARHLLKLADADVLVVGHTHMAFRLDVADAGVIVNPAALLRAPADGADNPPATATFGVLELPAIRFTVHDVTSGEERPAGRFKLGWFPPEPRSAR
jgi:putative phosphoesterase